MASNGKSNAVSICPGPIKRREFLRIGLSGFATLSLPGLFQLRALAATEKPKARTAVILVWLRGGASHLETYDPKPDALSLPSASSLRRLFHFLLAIFSS